MSTTSGPMVPPYVGASSDLSPTTMFALPFASIFTPLPAASRSPQFAEHASQFALRTGPSFHHQVQQVVVGHQQQPLERRSLRPIQLPPRARPETLEHQVQLQQPAPAAPLQALERAGLHYTARLTSSSLILPMASVGLRPFGQTS